MKKFSEFKVGEEFYSTCSISEKEFDTYLGFSRIKNVIFDDRKENSIVSGRAILARMEGEFTRLSQIYGNLILFYGVDGDQEWKNRSIRFLKPLFVDEVLKIKYKISDKSEIDKDYGLITVDYEGSKQNGELVVISKRNLYRIKKEPPRNQ